MEPDTFHERYATLSARQRDVLARRCHGASNADVARELFVAERTVRNHMTHILARMGLRGRCGSAAVCAHVRATMVRSRTPMTR
jgi:DNA-binding NarL/FixJ family response regulator